MDPIKGVSSSPNELQKSGKSSAKAGGESFHSTLNRHIAAAGQPQETKTDSVSHKIKPGDTLSGIVKQRMDRLGINYTTADLYRQVNIVAAANGLENPDVIYVGSTIDLHTVGKDLPQDVGGAEIETASLKMTRSPIAMLDNLSEVAHHHAYAETEPQEPIVQSELEFVAPATGRLTSRFGMRADPFTGSPRFHNGIDIALPTGTEVGSSASGRVTFVGRRGGYGNVVEVDHGGGLVSLYAHLQSASVTEGEEVLAGQTVGLSGQSGRSTGPHLHYEMRRDGEPVNPSGIMPLDTLPTGLDPAREVREIT